MGEGILPEAYRGLVYNTNDSTFWAIGTLFYTKNPVLYKFNQEGNPLDTVIVDNASNGYLFGQGYNDAINIDMDGNLLIQGQMQFNDLDQAFAIIFKLTPEGDTIWTKEYKLEGRYQYFSSLAITRDNDYVFTGFSHDLITGQDVWLVKLDSDGNTLWEQHYGGYGLQAAYAVDTTADGGFILSGFTTSHGAGERDAYIIKTDGEGNLLWEKWFGFEGNDLTFVKSLPNGHSIAFGGYNFYDPRDIALGLIHATHAGVSELDEDGNEVWFKIYGEIDSSTFKFYTSNEFFNDMLIVEDGYLFCGVSQDTLDDNPLGWIVKTDFQGNKLWSRRYRKRDNDNYLQDMVLMPNGDLVFVGFLFPDGTGNSQDGWILRTNCLGFEEPPTIAAEITTDSINNSATIINSSQRFGDGTIDWGDGTETYFTEHDDTIFTHIYAENGNYSINFKINTCNDHDSLNFETKITNVQPPPLPLSNFSIYPNPANQSVTIKYLPTNEAYSVTLSIYDLSGREVYYQSIIDFYNETTIDVSNYSAGTYLIRFSTVLGDVFLEKLVVYH